MNDFTGLTITGPLPQVSLSTTDWGYVIRPDSQLARRAVLIERVSAITGLAFMVLAFGSWLFPQVHAAVDVGAAAKMVSTLGLAVPALMFLWIAERGMARDIEVDLVKSTLRMCVCNRHGRARVLKDIPFEHVGSAYIKKVTDESANARLYLRLTGKKGIVEVASGRETTMRVLHQRLSQELRPKRVQLRGWERVGRKLQPASAVA